MLSLVAWLASILSISVFWKSSIALSVDVSLNLLLIVEETEVKLCVLLKYLGISCAKSKHGNRMRTIRAFIG